jgi:hypothetical protein
VGDPYLPGLRGGDPEGKYTTPKQYKLLFNNYIPNLPKKLCKYLINKIDSKDVQRKIIRYSGWPQKVRGIGSKLRGMSPLIFDKTLVYLNKKLR